MLCDMFVGLQVFLDMADTVLNLVTVVDMQVTGELAGTLIHLYDSFKQFLHTRTVLK